MTHSNTKIRAHTHQLFPSFSLPTSCEGARLPALSSQSSRPLAGECWEYPERKGKWHHSGDLPYQPRLPVAGHKLPNKCLYTQTKHTRTHRIHTHPQQMVVVTLKWEKRWFISAVIKVLTEWRTASSGGSRQLHTGCTQMELALPAVNDPRRGYLHNQENISEGPFFSSNVWKTHAHTHKPTRLHTQTSWVRRASN